MFFNRTFIDFISNLPDNLKINVKWPKYMVSGTIDIEISYGMQNTCMSLKSLNFTRFD